MDLTELNQQITLAGSEINSLLGGKKSSATKARKSLLLVKKTSDSLRRQILEYSKSSRSAAKEAKSAKPAKEVKEVKAQEAPAQENKEETKEEKPKKKAKGK